MDGTRRSAPLLTTRELAILALFAALVALSKAFLRMPLHVPGHSGITWMAILLVSRALVRRPGAGTLVGLVSGLLAVMIVGGREGLLVWVKYLAPGMVMDIGALLSGERLDRPLVAMTVAAAANAAKLTSSLIVSLVLGIPAGYIALGLGLAATTHVVFGAIGGWLGAFVVRTLWKLRIPTITALAPPEEITL
jgi:hypothetical protein